ncbi:hypothetical protein [Lewinella sp. LCG006]|uniref:hypothetical protein n=1 Tax=Lewinella sp. LCG006 TaxID=3231911 RepID=UPI00345FC642
MKPSNISKVGPIWKIDGGDIFLSPFKTIPLLEGYAPEKTLKPDTPLLMQVKERADEWFQKFPDCCDTHEKFKVLPNFSKEDYAFIPDQIVENLKYFGYCLEYFIGKDEWLDNVTQYLDYLSKSFGSPVVGGYLFEIAVKVLIENINLDNGDLSDDDRISLLEYFEPPKPDEFFQERDMTVLYETFQKWLKAIPNVGSFKMYKEQLTGKIPMNLFGYEMKFNKYLQQPFMKMRTKKELLDLLLKLTESHLKDLSRLIQEKRIVVIKDKNDLVEAAENRLQLEHSKLFKSEHSDEEIEYLELISKWFDAIIRYYETVSSYLTEDSVAISSQLDRIEDNTTDTLSNTDIIRFEMASLARSNSLREWADSTLGRDFFDKLDSEISDGRIEEERLKELFNYLQKYFLDVKNDSLEVKKLNEQIARSDVSVKHKLKLSIPIFLFTKYEAEVELSKKEQIPLTIAGIMKLLIKE